MRQQVTRETRWIAWLPLLILLAGTWGCGRTASVSGKVTYQGRPVTYGSVIFLSAGKVARSGVIKPDGSYGVEGVAPGAVKIAVISHDPAKGRSTLRGGKPTRPNERRAGSQSAVVSGWFPLPTRFEDPNTSGLDYTLGSGRVSHDLDLK